MFLDKERTHCGEVTSSNNGQIATVKGWVSNRRDHGGLIFIDLRDRSGLLQVTVNPDDYAEAHKIAEDVRSEWVLEITGTIQPRPEGTQNPALPTGMYELAAHEITILNSSLTPPFYIEDNIDVDEALRLKYRYLDLRRPEMYKILKLRYDVTKFIRNYLDNEGFLEIETPILIKSTPEGARDFLVPSRLQPGSFYALPQSPQQMKQLLMVAGVEKYFQIARCFRDEDLRADRQPEFTQLDLEMSFVTEEDIYSLTENLYTEMIHELTPEKTLPSPFPRLTYKEAMDSFGSDKPDLRFDLPMKDVTSIATQTDFKVFHSVIDNGGIIKAICIPGKGTASNNAIRNLNRIASEVGSPGLAHIRFTDSEALFSPGLSMNEELLSELRASVNSEGEDLIVIMAGEESRLNAMLGAFRIEVAIFFELIPTDTLAFCFVTEFPLFEYDESNQTWTSSHHPFTSPQEEDSSKLESGDYGNIKSKAYDLVCNGMELASGSIRIHEQETQQKIFEVLGYTEEEIHSQFGQILEAFQYGAPPHGGIAPGIDRLITILSGTDSIRDVIAFPKTQSGTDLLFGAPSDVDQAQLKDLGISSKLN
ncbi:MAG: aspartate--tRNA ligase [SAR202 cluster bacterium]|nr:aspartate--tRNA ligase [SAR202 cluster bacterium]MQG35672.1 aspartate--tRNA ligase [SAR202 cluster bacterium]MQG86441.1 aspartate--tRNA ligase [SAR202 cluster bacterium]